ncbi:P-loop containing nucleoside triphosphate hydrolase protein, partial [Armillaria luteobubalina]
MDIDDLYADDASYSDYIVDADLVQGLVQLFPNIPNPQFKSNIQQDVVKLSYQWLENFVAVMPTGGGKSLSWLLPAVLDPPDAITFVIIPNCDLLLDQMAHTCAFNIPTCQWTVADQDIQDSKVVYLALESAASHAFSVYWAHREDATSWLVIDEAHQVLSQSQFRHLFEKIKRLAAVPIPHIFLTATLPIHMEHDFLLEVGMPQSTRIIRAPTSHPNISYNLVRFDSNVTARLRLIRDLAKLMEDSFMSQGQIVIIFAQEIPDVEEIADALQCSRSHSRMNATHRAQDYNAWVSGQVQWMAATTTLTHGIDHPNISVCIFLHLVYGLLYLVQGSGHLLCQGGQSYCI